MEMKAEKPVNVKLWDQVGNLWAKHEENSKLGLVVLDKCIAKVAKDRDWDALARFVGLANKVGQRAKVVKIIRAAFGDKLTYKMEKKHAAGGMFVIGWEGAFPLAGQNSYMAVKKAIAEGKGWDDAAFSKALNEVVAAPVKAARVVDDKQKAKIVKHMAEYILARVAEGFNQGELIAAMQKELMGKAA